MKKLIKKTVKKLCVESAKFACGKASLNYSYQPKEPKALKAMFTKKK